MSPLLLLLLILFVLRFLIKLPHLLLYGPRDPDSCLLLCLPMLLILLFLAGLAV